MAFDIRQALREELQRLKKVQQHNIRTFRRQPLQEISGSFGDLGTLLPILIALANTRASDGQKPISVSSTFVFSGLANIFTGVMFGIPLPVQPMKAIAAVAIVQRFSHGQMASAGLFVASVVGFLSITGLLRWCARKIPIPIVKGIQLGTGLSLMISGGPWVLQKYAYLAGGWSLLILVATIVFLLFCQLKPRTPYVLVVLVIHLLVLIPLIASKSSSSLFSIWRPQGFVPSLSDFRMGALNAGVGQVPLTLLNSVVAVVYLSADLLPEVKTPSETAVGLSVASINLVACWFGAMPVCHGSGGLAAQYRFGARSGASIIFFGLIKLFIGLFAVEYALEFFSYFPKFQLGILLFIAGLELAKVGESLNTEGARDFWEYDDSQDGEIATEGKRLKNVSAEEKRRRWLVMTVTVGAILAARNDGVGFLVGLLLHGTYRTSDWLEARQSSREGRIRLEHDSSLQEPQEPGRAEP